MSMLPSVLRGLCFAMALIGLLSLGCGRSGPDQAISEANFDGVGAMVAENAAMPPGEAGNTEAYQPIIENRFELVARQPLSTFSADVNTASYANVRRFLFDERRLPPKDAVRLAELVNYFDYDYPKPRDGEPVGMELELAPCPWQPEHHLLRIAVAAKKFDPKELPARNLVFLIDVSGSMRSPNKLQLVKDSFRMLIEQLDAQDHVSIVTYAGNAGVQLEPTSGDQKSHILAVLDGLSAGGSTAGGDGLKLAYAQAARHFDPQAINRVIIATDGDFNVGQSSDAAMVRLIEEKRETGVFLTVLGFGTGNLKDSKLEQLARYGNGHYAYFDSITEAEKVFVDQGGALVTVAKDVKLQVEFNPAQVQAYRLLGYENRLLKAEDFKDDRKDAGDIGSGHTVTALYQMVPVGVDFPKLDIDPLKYQPEPSTPAGTADAWLTVKMRYKDPDGDTSRELARELPKEALQSAGSSDFQFATAAAEFGLLLRDSEYKSNADWTAVIDRAQKHQGPDPVGVRAEFIRMVQAAKQLKN